MKQVYFFLHVNFVVFIGCDNIQQGQHSLPMNKQFSNTEIATDRSIYISSPFQSPTPFFTLKNYNNLPLEVLPISQAKLLNTSPSPHPILLSSTIDYRNEFSEKNKRSDVRNSNTFLSANNNEIKSFGNKYETLRNRIGSDPHITNYMHQIDRMDTKMSTTAEPPNLISINEKPMSKTPLISLNKEKSEDLEQKASFHNYNYANPPNFIVQSTTEPAIPILRLSNEMDLDGSYSYEALGADQTHYQQHSRMENLGTDKEGQIVEGSYSYVGDNGQTYTVHYIADSNGYRATGDHLPVPPPIPEIIQRSIQYNLAEEARQQPNLKYYNEYENQNIPNSNEKKFQNYPAIPYNLFTGRTPEAFSFGFLQGTSSQNNETILKPKEPVKTNPELTEDKAKRNVNYEPLEPQVTFLASQGARLPVNVDQKPALPQLVNYEPDLKESENVKNLWRWQYGLNSNSERPNTSKNSISRSSSDGDDVIINFNEMTPAEYTNMIKNNVNTQSYFNNDLRNEQHTKKFVPEYNQHQNNREDDRNILKNNIFNSDIHTEVSSATNYIDDGVLTKFDKVNDTRSDSYDYTWSQINNVKLDEKIKQNNPFAYSTSTEAPQWFDYGVKPYESNRPQFNSMEYNGPNISLITGSDSPYNLNEKESEKKSVTTESYNKIYQYPKRNYIQPIETTHPSNIAQNKNNADLTTTTTENNIQEAIQHNMFLKNLLISKSHGSQKDEDRITEKAIMYSETVTAMSAQPDDKKSKSNNDINFIQNKPFALSDVLNYMANKNIFESNKLKISNKPFYVNNINQKYTYNADSNNESMYKASKEDPPNIYMRPQPQQHEMKGSLKNYKILQRNNVRNRSTEEENQFQSLQNKNNYSLKQPPLGRAGPSMKSYLPPIYL